MYFTFLANFPTERKTFRVAREVRCPRPKVDQDGGTFLVAILGRDSSRRVTPAQSCKVPSSACHAPYG